MRLTTLLRRADPLQRSADGLSPRGRAELRALTGPEPEPAASSRSARRPGWRAPVLVGALVAVILVVAVPLLQRPVQGVPTPPAASSVPASGVPLTAGRWVETASGPLSGRRDAITAWVAGSFLVVGGTTTRPCTARQGCADDPARLADGARYTPATDTWETITDAPIPLGRAGGAANPYLATTVIGHTLYLLQGGAFLAYDADTDRWTRLIAPPTTAYLAGAASDSVIAFPASVCGDDAIRTCRATGRLSYLRYDPDAAAWTKHVTRLAVPSSVYGATMVGRLLVVSWLEGSGLVAASIDLDSDTITARSPFRTRQRPMPVAAGGWAVWPRDARWVRLLDPLTFTTPNVALPTDPGALWVRVGGAERNLPIVAAGMIVLRGQFYDPSTGLWSSVPALPVPSQDPVIAGGADVALACNGWDGSRYTRSCYLLRPAPAGQNRP
ncbi:MAG: hypothetical protein QM695_13335 [Micropruina sp.]